MKRFFYLLALTFILSSTTNADAAPGVVDFQADSYEVLEGDTVTVTFVRTGGTDGAITGTLFVFPGSAESTVDYVVSPNNFSMADGQTTATVQVEALNDALNEGVEEFVLGFAATDLNGDSAVGTTAARTDIDILDAAEGVELTSHTDGDTLLGSVVTFEWEDTLTPNAEEYWLYVGSDIDTYNYFTSLSLGTNTTVTANGIPDDGSSPVFVRLWWRVGVDWFAKDYKFTAGAGMAAITIDSPAPGTSIVNNEATLKWTDTNNSANYWVYAGSRRGKNDYLDSGILDGSVEEILLSSLPADSQPVYVRLWYRLSLAMPWEFIDTVLGHSPVITTSTGEAQSPIDTFSWIDPGGTIVKFWLYVGSSVGANNLEDSGNLNLDSTYTTTEGNIPAGSAIFVRLWFSIDGTVWHFVDKEFPTAAQPN